MHRGDLPALVVSIHFSVFWLMSTASQFLGHLMYSYTPFSRMRKRARIVAGFSEVVDVLVRASLIKPREDFSFLPSSPESTLVSGSAACAYETSCGYRQIRLINQY